MEILEPALKAYVSTSHCFPTICVQYMYPAHGTPHGATLMSKLSPTILEFSGALLVANQSKRVLIPCSSHMKTHISCRFGRIAEAKKHCTTRCPDKARYIAMKDADEARKAPRRTADARKAGESKVVKDSPSSVDQDDASIQVDDHHEDEDGDGEPNISDVDDADGDDDDYNDNDDVDDDDDNDDVDVDVDDDDDDDDMPLDVLAGRKRKRTRSIAAARELKRQRRARELSPEV
jgi:hypothetical protein